MAPETQRVDTGRRAWISRAAAGGALLVGLVLVLVILFGGSSGRTYNLIFENGGQLVSGNQVLVAGQQIGTVSWEAWAHLQEGVAALDAGDVERAIADFAAAHRRDESPAFLELRLNSAYANARADDPMRWQQALAELGDLVEATAP